MVGDVVEEVGHRGHANGFHQAIYNAGVVEVGRAVKMRGAEDLTGEFVEQEGFFVQYTTHAPHDSQRDASMGESAPATIRPCRLATKQTAPGFPHRRVLLIPD